MAEVIKYGLIRDLPFFEWLEANIEKIMAREPAAVIHAIYESCRNKAEVVALDERETGIRAILNLGHTFGHAIETATGYGTWLHGEAVAMGTILALDMSERLIPNLYGTKERVIKLFTNTSLPTIPPKLGTKTYLDLMRVDKKVQDGQINLVLLERLGVANVNATYEQSALGATLESVCAT